MALTEERLRQIKAIAFDIDGVMTDGGILAMSDGDLLRIFDAKDSFGVRMAKMNGLHTAVITGGSSDSILRRFSVCGVDEEDIYLHSRIKIDDFKGVELRSAEILTCEPVPKAKKLYRIEVDLGYEKRQIVSGIAKYYQPADLIGKKVMVVANLAPATLCGVESKGMLLASGEEDVRVIFLDPATPNGERIH